MLGFIKYEMCVPSLNTIYFVLLKIPSKNFYVSDSNGVSELLLISR